MSPAIHAVLWAIDSNSSETWLMLTLSTVVETFTNQSRRRNKPDLPFRGRHLNCERNDCWLVLRLMWQAQGQDCRWKDSPNRWGFFGLCAINRFTTPLCSQWDSRTMDLLWTKPSGMNKLKRYNAALFSPFPCFRCTEFICRFFLF